MAISTYTSIYNNCDKTYIIINNLKKKKNQQPEGLQMLPLLTKGEAQWSPE